MLVFVHAHTLHAHRSRSSAVGALFSSMLPPLSEPLLVGVGLGLLRAARTSSMSSLPLRRPERTGEVPPRAALRLRLRARLRGGEAQFLSGDLSLSWYEGISLLSHDFNCDVTEKCTAGDAAATMSV